MQDSSCFLESVLPFNQNYISVSLPFNIVCASAIR